MMIRVNKSNPCPICERPDWCLYSEDAAICARVSEGSTKKCGDAGFLHILKAGSKPSGKHFKRYMPKPVKDFTAESKSYQAAISAEQTEILALSLGVSIDSLERLCVGWDGESYTFPMRNENRKIIGIRRRFIDGRKFSVKGSSNGLFIPKGITEVGELLICEGPTDTAAALDLNFDAIGRPNCNSKIGMTVKFARGRKVTVISDRDTAGVNGAKKLARRLVKHCPEVMIMVPPPGMKDLRQWKNNGFGNEVRNNGF